MGFHQGQEVGLRMGGRKDCRALGGAHLEGETPEFLDIEPVRHLIGLLGEDLGLLHARDPVGAGLLEAGTRLFGPHAIKRVPEGEEAIRCQDLVGLRALCIKVGNAHQMMAGIGILKEGPCLPLRSSDGARMDKRLLVEGAVYLQKGHLQLVPVGEALCAGKRGEEDLKLQRLLFREGGIADIGALFVDMPEELPSIHFLHDMHATAFETLAVTLDCGEEGGAGEIGIDEGVEVVGIQGIAGIDELKRERCDPANPFILLAQPRDALLARFLLFLHGNNLCLQT